MTMTDRLTAPAALRCSRAPASTEPVRIWLWCCAVLVFAMVVVGGATRLTEAGLSITEWKLVSGVLPPLNDAQWQSEFAKYKLIPQYAQLFPAMDLNWFKFIYFFEWGHRLLGRVVGIAFALPLAFFWLSGRLPAFLKPRLLILLALGGLQGVVGWWMVTSGLSNRVEVSQYRLAVHLLLASVTFAWLIWLAVRLTPRANTGIANGSLLERSATVLLALIFVQVGLGALVAGLRAGLAYNTWPLMDRQLIPPLSVLAGQTPWWSNFFENVTTVQFQHRVTAYLVLALAIGHLGAAVRVRGAVTGALIVACLAMMQAAIGITALLLVVPLWAALLHQAFAMLLLGSAVAHRSLLTARPAQAAALATRY